VLALGFVGQRAAGVAADGAASRRVVGALLPGRDGVFDELPLEHLDDDGALSGVRLDAERCEDTPCRVFGMVTEPFHCILPPPRTAAAV
jgi:hypothetical protein